MKDNPVIQIHCMKCHHVHFVQKDEHEIIFDANGVYVLQLYCDNCNSIIYDCLVVELVKVTTDDTFKDVAHKVIIKSES